MNMIELDKISHNFGNKKILDSISFKVAEGEIFGLLGPSGAGKTTIIKILTGQLHQNSGTANLMGIDTDKLTDREYSKTGIMMDNLGLYDRLSVYDNLSFYADIYRADKKKIDGILESMNLAETKKTPVSKLSKGMKNRLSLARALMNDAKIIFLDEPTSGLDPMTTREIHSVLRKQKENGKTIFLTTHNMYEAETLCDNVALLNYGHIVEYGNPGEICAKHNRLNKLEIILKNGTEISMENSRNSAEKVREYLSDESIKSIHSTEPDLESVFVELTGRGLE